ncbi:restriction endonuclease [Burkholderia sp. TSV86]|uniref:restriction endonuclease n=1 Tax=Burkholderia sp. TSV86 TaxID=1385594 RepID=UPI00075D5193|nr:restriction endonuclease [Burkholderia sp. TSV86]KVE37231.1 hypothetical protein WS68_03185 [Burkholderia sp. TSV86]
MSRRKKNRPGLLTLASRGPWWVGASIATAILAVEALAATASRRTGPLGAALAVVQSKPVALLAIAVALLFFGAAVVAALRGRERANLLDVQRDLNSLKALDWRQFERLVAEAYRRLGYRVRVTGQGGADGGVDLILTRGTEKVIVQCKQWQSTSIGASVVREMFGLMAHHKATAVAIVCTGKFTRDAATFAAGKPIELVTGNALAELVESVRRGGVSPARARPVAAGSRRA